MTFFSILLGCFTYICMVLQTPEEKGTLRTAPLVPSFELIAGEFDKINVKMWRGMNCEVLRNKDFEPTSKPTIIFYHGFPDN